MILILNKTHSHSKHQDIHICVVRTGFLVVIQMTKDAGCGDLITSLGFYWNDDDKLVSGQALTSSDPLGMERSFAAVSGLALSKAMLFSLDILWLEFCSSSSRHLYLWGFYLFCLVILSLDWLRSSINTDSFFYHFLLFLLKHSHASVYICKPFYKS